MTKDTNAISSPTHVSSRFQAAPRLLVPGDTFAVLLPPVGPLDGVLATLNNGSLLGSGDGADSIRGGGGADGSGSGSGDGSGDGAQAATASHGVKLQPGGRGGRLVYFKVSELRPASDIALVVEPTSTAISIQVRQSTGDIMALHGDFTQTSALSLFIETHDCLPRRQGLTCGALPVGASAYAAAAAAAESCSGDPARNSASAGAADVPSSPGALAARLLGWSPNAAAASMHSDTGGAAALPGVGLLLPAWRELAHILAPLFHPVRLPVESIHMAATLILALEAIQYSAWLAAFAKLHCSWFVWLLLQRAGDLSVRASVLLHGAPGSGRSTAASAVAAAFGAHLVPINCHDLKASGLDPKQSS